MRKARDEEMAKQCAAWAKAEEPLVQALESIGCPVKFVWGLVNTAKPYPEAIPVLVDYLRPAYPSRIKEGIIRALAVPDSRPYWPVLVDLLDTAPSSPDNLRWAAACALNGAADESVIDDVIRIIKDDNLGFDLPHSWLLLLDQRMPRLRCSCMSLEAIRCSAKKSKRCAGWDD